MYTDVIDNIISACIDVGYVWGGLGSKRDVSVSCRGAERGKGRRGNQGRRRRRVGEERSREII